jgi:hypothetical protein
MVISIRHYATLTSHSHMTQCRSSAATSIFSSYESKVMSLHRVCPPTSTGSTSPPSILVPVLPPTLTCLALRSARCSSHPSPSCPSSPSSPSLSTYRPSFADTDRRTWLRSTAGPLASSSLSLSSKSLTCSLSVLRSSSSLSSSSDVSRVRLPPLGLPLDLLPFDLGVVLDALNAVARERLAGVVGADAAPLAPFFLMLARRCETAFTVQSSQNKHQICENYATWKGKIRVYTPLPM